MYLSSSKIAVAVGGNFAFAMALCLYKVMVKVRSCISSCLASSHSLTDDEGPPREDGQWENGIAASIALGTTGR